MKLRTLIFWPHLCAGVTAGIVILVMSVTGVLLTYERQLVAWSDSQYRSTVPAQGGDRLPVETLLQTIRSEHPDVAVNAITVGSAPDAAVTVAVPQRTLYFDAYSGRLLGEGSQGMRRFMSETRRGIAGLPSKARADRSLASSPAGPTSSSSSSSSRGSISGSRANGPGTTCGRSCCSTAQRRAKLVTSTGTT